MKKTKIDIYENIISTYERLEKLYFSQKEMLKKLYNYIELRKQQLIYYESIEEIDFILVNLDKIIREINL